ncbi:MULTISPECIES: Kelch repeat-containing protein [unclassified Arsukibacterium]|uniref:Kelch repeat-containing protein n=1 Tax=unclassified Arsukibacterium TaxID=2635278 RepID=UPI000C9375EB|nr:MULTISPECIES: galactose oxidase [unclassified Arsukibacterium]MAA94291.1 galactose oxidase [Rheinheimera sp.]HAW93877.1 galactose oxidase [Candidatus Azambacteria bacterium]
MLLKSLSCLSLLMATASSIAIPDLPEPVSNNSAASTTVRGKTYIVSALGIGPGKQSNDLHNKVWMHTLGEFGWSELPTVPSQQRLTGRAGASMVALNNNFFLFGGFTLNPDGSKQTAADSYRLDPVTQRYTRINDMPVPVDDAVALPYQNRYIYLASGWSDHGNVNLMQLFDNFTQRWSQATPYPGKPVSGLAGGIVGNTLLLCDGVAVEYPAAKPRTFVMEPACWQGIIDTKPNEIAWQQIPHPTGNPRFRMAATGTELNGEQVIVFVGGSQTPYIFNAINFQGRPVTPSSEVWVYSVTRQQWRTAAQSSAIMDSRTLLDIEGTLYTLGGMIADQQVTNKPIKHQIQLLPD